MTTPAILQQVADTELWPLVGLGDAAAFKMVVERHQSAVCAVAYNACGDLGFSEDVAQETFWTAWRERTALADPGRLRAWLCGIARNLGNNARRKASRRVESTLDQMGLAEPPATASNPAEAAVSREEEALVWQTLERIPESYREPLILFYREQQSVAQVAAALELSEDAVKQRLSRGRSMVRDRVAGLIEGTLVKSRPGRKFTLAVMTGVAAASTGAKTAFASAGAAQGAKMIGAGMAGGAFAGLASSLVGLAGAWFGVWIPAQLAPTNDERKLLQRAGRRMLLIGLVYLVVLFGAAITLPAKSVLFYLIFWAFWMATFAAYIVVESVRLARAVKQLHTTAGPTAVPNDAPLRQAWTAVAGRCRGRVFRSRWTLLGLPLLDVQVSDPTPLTGGTEYGLQPRERQTARGWAAVGDDARGVLLAVGANTACGFIALGGRSLGVFSFGGVAAGLFAVGGLAVGLVSIGGAAIGIFSIGGLAVGWQAAGGAAIAWDVAVGGGAVACRGAFGGGAIAREFALGGAAQAIHANDDAAKAVLLNHPLKLGMDWYIAHNGWITALLVALGAVPALAAALIMYRRVRPDETAAPPTPE